MLINFDIIILGDGPAGCAAALTFESNGYAVAIVGSSKTDDFPTIESIDASVAEDLLGLHFNHEYLNEHHTPLYETISLWDSDEPIFKDSIYNAHGNGWTIDKLKFNKQLRSKCADRGIPIFKCDELEIKRHPQKGWLLTCDLMSLHGLFLVDCSGRRRILLKKLSIPVQKYDSLIAINKIFDAAISDPSLALLIEADNQGWWYSSSFLNKKRIVSFFTNAKSDALKDNLIAPHFNHKLLSTQLISQHLKCYSDSDEKPHVRYANSEISSELFGNDWICAGDAAAAFDPLSSQGVGTAIRMGIVAAKAASKFLENADSTAMVQFRDNYRELFHNYLVQRNKFYSKVHHWPDSVFWNTNAQEINEIINKNKTI
ncbi:NAD(P)/FAD-dependent oxidoreductase [Flavobacterium sp. 25HG05S-40]|uniref:NAD(P)/FAD-dependent oxidoreductase n=1 Tax=Flavobacterium sp. 25HG05S-40 TaxID=3458682 RepID=UPI004044B1AB